MRRWSGQVCFSWLKWILIREYENGSYIHTMGLFTGSSEVCGKKPKGKYFPVQTEQTRLIRHLLYGFWFIFSSVYSAVFLFRCCRSPYPWVSSFRFMFTLFRHSFVSFIDKQISRKATLMFQDVLLFELFWRVIVRT